MSKYKFLSKICVISIIILFVLIQFSIAIEENKNIIEMQNEVIDENDNKMNEENVINKDNEIIKDIEIEEKNESEINNLEKQKIEIKEEAEEQKVEVKKENDAIVSEEKVRITYSTHIQDIGWEKDFSKSDGQISGTEGKSKRLEGIRIKGENLPEDARIEYKVHVQDIGWQEWRKDGKIAGTQGKSLRLEGIMIRLVNMPEYSVEYRVHVQNIGWQEWRKNGAIAGTTGESLRLEAIQIRIIKHESEEPIETDEKIHIQYKSHVQDIGWQSNVMDGAVSGTSGQSRRIEAMVINAYNLPEGVKLKYRAHVQDIGWQNWVDNGGMIGTSGKSLRMEAVKFKLENTDEYSIMYRAHVQDYGWQDWCYDGEMSGTIGEAKRVEAIQIKIVNKITEQKARVYIDYLGTIPNEIQQITGWYMTNIKDTTLKVLIDDEEFKGTINKIHDQSVFNQIKGYGGEELNQNPRFILNVDFSKYSLGKHIIKAQIILKNGDIVKEISETVNVEKKIEITTGVYGISGLKAKGDGRGTDLKYYKYGSGPNVFFATFCVHGFEDKWIRDGTELVIIANSFFDKLKESKDYDLAKKWTIYIFPEVNPDGRNYGWSDSGPGRTTLYSLAEENIGIDINRCWSTSFQANNNKNNRRYYTGPQPFLAYEAIYLRDFLLSHKSQNGQTLLVDLHGWTQQLIGDETIRGYYKKQFPENIDTPTYGKGYLINWARTNLGSNNKVAKSALIELPDYIESSQDVKNYNLPNRYIDATLNMLRKIDL